MALSTLTLAMISWRVSERPRIALQWHIALLFIVHANAVYLSSSISLVPNATVISLVSAYHNGTVLPSPTLPNLGPLVTTFTPPSSCSSVASQWINVPQKSPSEAYQTLTPLLGGLPDCYPPGFYDATYSTSLMPRASGFKIPTQTSDTTTHSTTSMPVSRAENASHTIAIVDGRTLSRRAVVEYGGHGNAHPSTSTRQTAAPPYYSPGFVCPASYTTASTYVRDDTETRVFCCPTHYSILASTLCRHSNAAAITVPLATHSFNGTVYTPASFTPTVAANVSSPTQSQPPFPYNFTSSATNPKSEWNDTYVTVYAFAIELRHLNADYAAYGLPSPRETKELAKGAVIGIAVGLAVGIPVAIGVFAYIGRWKKDRRRKKMIKSFKEKARGRAGP